jgi:hypothetical protein
MFINTGKIGTPKLKGIPNMAYLRHTDMSGFAFLNNLNKVGQNARSMLTYVLTAINRQLTGAIREIKYFLLLDKICGVNFKSDLLFAE